MHPVWIISTIRQSSRSCLTIGSGEEALVVAADLVGQVLGDVHVGVHLLPDLLQRCVQVSLPVVLIQVVYQLCQLDLEKTE